MPLYSYVCTGCEETTDEIFKYDDRPEIIKCPLCDTGVAEYMMGKPAHFRIAIDGNGRKGYKMDMGNGKQTVRSSTREQYEHRAGNMPVEKLKGNVKSTSESVYTKAYSEHLQKEENTKKAKFLKEFKEKK